VNSRFAASDRHGGVEPDCQHLLAPGTYGLTWVPILLLHCFRDREKILDLFEETCGPAALQLQLVGGLMYDIPAGFEKKVIDFWITSSL
jgi:NADH:ubiquinone oxidoreductase subunit D